MAYFKKQDAELAKMLELFNRDDHWLITINADPDAMASAMALRRIMAHRVATAEIARVNTITRPDNLAMIRYLRIPMKPLTPQLIKKFNRFAMVDSQPAHHPDFTGIDYSIVVDHHPTRPDQPVAAPFHDIRSEYGAVSTMFTQYLYNLGIRPGKLLATALLFGIKTDTANFERNFQDVDIRAYRYLSKFSDHNLLRRIVRSEYHIQWLPYFTSALNDIHAISSGLYTYVGAIENPDILVFIADFLMRIHEVRWAAVCGVSEGKIVVILRGDGVGKDLGAFAAAHFGDVGSAGGHKGMARAEIPLEAADGHNLEFFVYKRLTTPAKAATPPREAEPAQ